MRVARHLVIGLLFLSLAPTALAADSLTVAVAADLQFAMQELAARFEKQSGTDIRLSFGSSGDLTTQIEQGAPFDLFFSADVGYPERLVREGFAKPGFFLRYAVGNLVVYVPSRPSLNLDKDGINSLLNPTIQKIAIANPRFAPYGRAAVAALKHFKLYQRVKQKLVLGENISQALQFVESGNAQAGILALALVLAPPMRGHGKYWLIPAGSYPPLEQGAVIVKSSKHQRQARDFLNFLKSPEAAGILKRYGFGLPKQGAE